MRLLSPTLRVQAGDTIVEVLIAMTVISSVLVGAYGVTRSSLGSTEDAQERSQAVKLVESQIEYLHTIPAGTAPFCYYLSGTITTPASTNANCTITAGGAPAGSAEPAYSMAINVNSGTGLYTISATWNAVSGHGRNNVTYYYRPAN